MYAKIDDNGYIIYSVQSSFAQTDLTEIDYEIGICSDAGFQFNVNSKTWVDTRTDQQKYDEASQPIIQKRNQLLSASDWTQIPGNPLTTEQQTAWATYRQELRDITAQSGYPFNVIWPTPPT
jgi:hypothetical protein